MDPIFPDTPEDFAALSDDELRAFVTESSEAAAAVAENPDQFVGDGRTNADLLAEMQAGVETLEAARAVLNTRSESESEGDTADKPEGEGDGDAEGDAEAPEGEAAVEADAGAEGDNDFATQFEELAARAADESDEAAPEGEGTGAEAPEGEPAAEAVVASADDSAPAPAPTARPAPARRARPAAPAARLPRPARSAPAAPREQHGVPATLTASAGGMGVDAGEQLESGLQIAEMMVRRRNNFGVISTGTKGEQLPIAALDWRGAYSEERTLSLGDDALTNQAKIDAVVDQGVIRVAMEQRKKLDGDAALLASGGLCAPVTPYYQLQMISVPDRPVRAALAAFNADRGGIRFARPASLAIISTAVGIVTAAEDLAGGSSAEKSCQVVECPDWEEVDVQTIFHCLQFGNLGSRTFPERVAQWNNLVLAAHARTAESELLTGIKTASTAVNAGSLGLGASATLPNHIITAAAGMRSRHRMADDAVLRVLLPSWTKELIVSDVYRSQFDRFEMTPAQFVQILRAANVEPSFYKDGAAGASQVFGTQAPGDLLSFPTIAEWYLFPEGSFLFIDGGVLELGLVRDSVLNSTNDYQIFGESFENVAFVGVESLAVRSTVCDSGAVSIPKSVTCPIDY